MIDKITPVSKLLFGGEHFTLKFSQTAGKQKQPNFDGEPMDTLETAINGKPYENPGSR